MPAAGHQKPHYIKKKYKIAQTSAEKLTTQLKAVNGSVGEWHDRCRPNPHPENIARKFTTEIRGHRDNKNLVQKTKATISIVNPLQSGASMAEITR